MEFLLWSFCCLFAVGNAAEFYPINEKDDMGLKSTSTPLLVFSTMVALIIKWLMKYTGCPIPYQVPLMIAGCILGGFRSKNQLLSHLTNAIHIDPSSLIFFIIPITLFKSALSIDSHIFFRCLSQLVIISIPGTLFRIAFTSVIFMCLIGNNDILLHGLLFANVCAPTYPDNILKHLKEMNSNQYVITLLEGERLLSESIVLMIFGLIEAYNFYHITEWYHIINVFLRLLIGGAIFGWIYAKILCWCIGGVQNDSMALVLITIIANSLTFYINVEYIGVSGTISTVVIALYLNMKRVDIHSNVESFLLMIWEILDFVVTNFVVVLAGIITGSLIGHIKPSTIPLMFVAYSINVVGRLLFFLIAAPILSRIGYGMTFSSMWVLVCGGVRGMISLLFIPKLYSYKLDGNVQIDLILYVFGMVIFSQIISTGVMSSVLRLLGYLEISTVKKNNMNNCVKFMEMKRQSCIWRLKMNRFFTDANWPVVYEATILRHPYSIKLTDDDDDTYLGYRIATCMQCKREVLSEPTVKEMIEMRKEARLRILKAERISVSRQYEKGILTKEGLRVLIQAIDVAMESETAVIELEGLHKLFHKKTSFTGQKLYHLLSEKLVMDNIKPPRNNCRRVCYDIVKHTAFQAFIYCTIVTNVSMVILTLILNPPYGDGFYYTLKGFALIYFLIYLTEFWLKVLAYSYILIWKHGIKIYFSSYWNMFDFVILCSCSIDLLIDAIDIGFLHHYRHGDASIFVFKCISILRIIRLFRLLRLLEFFFPKLIVYCSKRIDERLAFAYCLGKGFVEAQDDVCDVLPLMINNNRIRDECRARIEADRLAVTRELGLVQKNKPLLAITVKTKQAIRSILTFVKNGIITLKVSGWLDDFEYESLMQSLYERWIYCARLGAIVPSTPKVVFSEISWIQDNDQTAEFLYERVVTKVYDSNEIICKEGELCAGIYVVITGLVKVVYTPKDEYIDALNEYGALPIVDCLPHKKIYEHFEDYFTTGSCIGELGTLTERPYNCTVRAEVASHMYILTRKVMHEAFSRSRDPLKGLQARIWKTVSINLATSLLMDVPLYQSFNQEQIHYQLENAFMPNLSNFKALALNNLMEDMLLIEGVAVDYNTRDLYTAPQYIPRNVQKILLPRSSQMNFNTNVNTRVLIIPARDVDVFELMALGEEMCLFLHRNVYIIMLEPERDEIRKPVNDLKLKLIFDFTDCVQYDNL